MRNPGAGRESPAAPKEPSTHGQHDRCLRIGNAKIKQLGGHTSESWDWALMVQINLPNSGTPLIQCYASDPQMDVDA